MAKRKLNRKYKIKDIDMLSACETIITHVAKHKVLIQSKQSTWSDPFFENLQRRIQAAYSNLLGIDSIRDLKEATQKVLALQAMVVDDINEFKAQIQDLYKKDLTRLNELLINLGFHQYHKDAQKGDQEAVIQLLYKFKDNMAPDLKTEIVNKGIAENIINEISGHAEILREFNVSQESLKGSRKKITKAAVAELNEIYEEVINVTKTAVKFI